MDANVTDTEVSNTNQKEEQNMNVNEILAQMARLQEMNEKLLAKAAESEKQLAEERKKKSERRLSFKVSQQGAVTVLGLRRYGVTCYPLEWQRIFAQKDELLKFIDDNKGKLSMGAFKGDVNAPAAENITDEDIRNVPPHSTPTH